MHGGVGRPSTPEAGKADLEKAVDAPLSGLMLLLQLLCTSPVLHLMQPALPAAVHDIQAMEPDSNSRLGLLHLLVCCSLLLPDLLLLCMLCHAMPGLKDAVLSEEVVKGGGDVLEVGLAGLVLCMLHRFACGHHPVPCLRTNALTKSSHNSAPELPW